MRVSASERLKGMAVGSLLLSLFGGLWMVAALNAQSLVWILCCVAVPASLLVLRSAGLLHTSAQVRAAEPEPDDAAIAAARTLGRRFALLMAGEFTAFMVAVNVLAVHAVWIVGALALISAGFLLLWAWAFSYVLYAWTGGIEISLCLLIVLLMRTRLAAADPLFGLSMGLTLWLTVVVTLAQGSRWGSRLKAAAAAQA